MGYSTCRLPAAKTKTFGFIHIATMGNWREVVSEQLELLRSSGLCEKTTRIWAGIVGPECDLFSLDDEKVEVFYRDKQLEKFEFLTAVYGHDSCTAHGCSNRRICSKIDIDFGIQLLLWLLYMQSCYRMKS